MESQKITNLLYKLYDQLLKLRTREWVVVDDFTKTDKQIEFYTCMLKSSLCGYSGYYALLKGTITITGARADAAGKGADESNKQVTLKKYALFTNCVSQTSNTEVENAEYLDIIMPMYNLKESNGNYKKKCHIFYDSITKIFQKNSIRNSKSVSFKENVTGRTPAEMPLVIC